MVVAAIVAAVAVVAVVACGCTCLIIFILLCLSCRALDSPRARSLLVLGRRASPNVAYRYALDALQCVYFYASYTSNTFIRLFWTIRI